MRWATKKNLKQEEQTLKWKIYKTKLNKKIKWINFLEKLKSPVEYERLTKFYKLRWKIEKKHQIFYFFLGNESKKWTVEEIENKNNSKICFVLNKIKTKEKHEAWKKNLCKYYESRKNINVKKKVNFMMIKLKDKQRRKYFSWILKINLCK